MSDQDTTADKTEPATPRKRQKARQEGQVARSQDLNNAVILLTSVLVLYYFGEWMFGRTLDFMRLMLPRLGEYRITPDAIVDLGRRGIAAVTVLMLPLFVAVIVMALAANMLQVGFTMTSKPLELKFDRLNPITGIRRVFSMRSIVRLFGSFFKLGVIGGVLWYTLSQETDEFFIVIDQTAAQIVAYIGVAMFRLALRTAIALLILAILDYAYQRWQFERDLRMTKQEVKDELKLMEGDPRVRARRRQIALQLAQQRMMASVPKADVVVTNPTFLAIAIAYKKEMAAPKVLAKGAGAVAQRIRDVAAEHSIPVVQKKDLAQALFKGCEIGDPVPEELWQAVAEILAYVYQMGKSPAML